MNYSDFEFESLEDLRNDPFNFDPFDGQGLQDAICCKCGMTVVWQDGEPPTQWICPNCK